MAYQKSGSPFLYDDVSGDAVGLRDSDGGESYFAKYPTAVAAAQAGATDTSPRYRSAVADLVASYYANKDRARVMSTPPTVTPTAGAVPGTYPAAYEYYLTANRSLIAVHGGVANSFQNAGFYWNVRAATSNLAGTTYNPTAVGWYTFRTTSEKFAIKVLASNLPYRIKVDGQYVSLAGHTTAGNTGAQYLLVDFTSAGGRKEREIAVEVQEEDTGFYGVYTAATDGITTPEYSERIVVGADSIGVGTVTDTANGTYFPRGDGFSYVMSQILGVPDVWSSGISGTGWCNPAAGSVALPDRIVNDVCARDPIAALLSKGTNDYNTGYATNAQVKAAVTLAIARVRAVKPNLPLIITGIWGGVTGPSATVTSMETAIKEAVDAAIAGGDRYVGFIPIATRTTKPLIFGTGRQTSTNGTGNSDWVIGDGTHLTIAGNEYIAYFVTAEAIALLRQMFRL